MDLQKLIDTMCGIIGEKHHIRIKAEIKDRGDFLQHEGVDRFARKNKSEKSSVIY